ncbi:hypothetical protein LJC18_03875 [Lachnospiraceae bacterium OttesenSCG-928-E19]|nr:hypothetical protein [Lachnospiraceae bacterium OttesenSCG-928-E19]
MKNLGHDTEQTTRATIGGGTIIVGGTELSDDDPALAGLNRDVDDTQKITKDKITGALDGSVTIDNRLLTPEGRKNIAEQHRQIGEAVEKSWDHLNNIFTTTSKKDMKDALSSVTLKRAESLAALDIDFVEPIKPENVKDMDSAIEFMFDLADNIGELSEVQKGQLKYVIENFNVSKELFIYKNEKIDTILDGFMKNDPLLKQFDNYDKLSVSEKKDLVKNIAYTISYGFGADENIKFEFDNSTTSKGSYNASTNTFSINFDFVESVPDLMNTIFHEIAGHKVTADLVNKGEKPKDMSDQAWKEIQLSNSNIYKNNYVQDGIYYKVQPSEMDSWNSGDYSEKQFKDKMNAQEFIKSIKSGVNYAPKY